MQGKWERNWWGGEALWQGLMAVIQTVTADKKIMENLGGTQQLSIALLSLLAGFLFSPYSNIHIFEYI
jgi:hypothetical protein